MNVLFVCAAGASTNVLKRKLMRYSQSLGAEDMYDACGYMNIENHLDQVDIVCVAPQVIYAKDMIEKELEDKAIPYIMLQEKDLSLTSVNELYDRFQKVARPKRKAADEQPTGPTGIGILRTAGDSFLTALCIGLGYLMFSFICKKWNICEESCLLQHTFSCMMLVTAAAAGYQYGKRNRLNVLPLIFLNMMECMLLFGRIQEEMFPKPLVYVPGAAVIIAICLIMDMVYHWILRRPVFGGAAVSQAQNYWNSVFPFFIVTMVCLLVHVATG